MITIIAALSENNVIGAEGGMPWREPQDLKYFKKMTIGKPVIMGMNTFVSIGSKPLISRHNIVLTRQEGFYYPGVYFCPTPWWAIMTAMGFVGEKMVIGGAQIYQEFMPYCERLLLTRIPLTVHGEELVYFPDFDKSQWYLKSECSVEGNAGTLIFQDLRKREFE